MRQIILLVKHAPTSASFYVSTLGLKINNYIIYTNSLIN